MIKIFIREGKYKGYKFFIDKNKNKLYLKFGNHKLEIFKNIDSVDLIANNNESENNIFNCTFVFNNELCSANIPYEIYIILILKGLREKR